MLASPHATGTNASRQELDSYAASDPSPAYHAAMSFFEPPAPPPGPVSRAMVVSSPPWLGPPLNALPGIAPVELVIARTDETVVALAGIQAYPAGFGFTLCLRLRTVSPREEQQFPYLLDRVPVEGGPLPDELLRFGVQFADGRKATNLDRPSYDPDREPDRPVLNQHGGAAAAWPGTWGTGCGRCRRRGRSPSCVSGQREPSRSRGPRSTPGRSWKRPGAP
jgi:hypothetical protein